MAAGFTVARNLRSRALMRKLGMRCARDIVHLRLLPVLNELDRA